ncbi:MAG: DUF2203 domain-containing protein [Blastocatellia bacterium]
MRIFKLDEANALLPMLGPKLQRTSELYKKAEEFRDQASAAASASQFGGGMLGGSVYIRTLYEIGKLTTEIAVTGAQLKDYRTGLIDFPSVRDGRLVLLCWKPEDGDEIAWWHEMDAGFAGRQPI